MPTGGTGLMIEEPGPSGAGSARFWWRLYSGIGHASATANGSQGKSPALLLATGVTPCRSRRGPPGRLGGPAANRPPSSHRTHAMHGFRRICGGSRTRPPGRPRSSPWTEESSAMSRAGFGRPPRWSPMRENLCRVAAQPLTSPAIGTASAVARFSSAPQNARRRRRLPAARRAWACFRGAADEDHPAVLPSVKTIVTVPSEARSAQGRRAPRTARSAASSRYGAWVSRGWDGKVERFIRTLDERVGAWARVGLLSRAPVASYPSCATTDESQVARPARPPLRGSASGAGD
jgi:hypothetical protein